MKTVLFFISLRFPISSVYFMEFGYLASSHVSYFCYFNPKNSLKNYATKVLLGI